MRVVIRRQWARRETSWAKRSSGRLAAGAGLMFQLFAMGCFAVCAWRWSFDLGLVQSFPAEEGLFARWQMWFAAGATLQIFTSLLARYAHSLQQSEAGDRARLRSSLNRRAA